MFELDFINVAVLLAAVANTVYGMVIYSRNREDDTNFAFFILTLTVSAWGFSMFLYRGFDNITFSTFAARLLYVAASSIPLAFLYFTTIFPKNEYSLKWWLKLSVPLPFLAMIITSILPDGLIQTIQTVSGGEKIIVFNFFFHLCYALYIVSYFGLSYLVLYKKYKTASHELRLQISYIFIGTFLATSIGVTTNLVLPILNIFTFNWVGQVGIVVMITSITYAILKYKLFNVRVLIADILVFTLWVAIFVQILLSQTLNDQIFNSILLTITVIVGIFLIRSVIKEVKAHEEVEKLAHELEKANVKLIDADKQKSEFVSVASHQLRGPLAAIKGYGSLILEGSFGVAPPAIKDAVQKMFDSSQSLVVTVQDYLDVSRIEQGRMKYNFSLFDLKELVQNIVAELEPTIKKTGLALTFSFTPEKETFMIFADIGKIKQIIENIIDNAMKYTQKGSVAITLEKHDGNNVYVIKIKDTGVGISKDTLPKLFNKFTRASDANEVNVMGSGLGLYVASEMTKAHHGKVWAESDGPGLGSTFIIELPQNKDKEHEESVNKFAESI